MNIFIHRIVRLYRLIPLLIIIAPFFNACKTVENSVEIESPTTRLPEAGMKVEGLGLIPATVTQAKPVANPPTPFSEPVLSGSRRVFPVNRSVGNLAFREGIGIPLLETESVSQGWVRVRARIENITGENLTVEINCIFAQKENEGSQQYSFSPVSIPGRHFCDVTFIIPENEGEKFVLQVR